MASDEEKLDESQQSGKKSVVEDLEEREDEAEPVQKQSSKKVGGKKTSKKRQQRKTLDEKKQRILEGAIHDAKKEFEKLKAETLSAIPETYKSMFGQIGFTKWKKEMIPVLILSPFDVSPGPVRDGWLQMFERVSSVATEETILLFS